MIVARVLGWFLVVVGLTWAAVMVSLWVAGHDLTAPAGQLWYQLDPGGLNRTQSIVQRYVHPGLWDHGFLPLLQRPAYATLAYVSFIPLVAGALIVIRARPRGGRKRMFR